MYKFIALFAIVALAAAAPQHGSSAYGHHQSSHGSSSDDAHAEIKVLHSDVRADGFNYALETTNGIHAQQAGDEHGNVHGDYEYVSPEGVHVRVAYVADENGYQPSSDLLPTSPPIPDAILKSLEYIRTHPPKDEVHSAYGKKHF